MTAPAYADSPHAAAGLPTVRAPGLVRRELSRYFACSALALAADTGLFAALLALGAGWAAAAAAGFGIGLAVAYTLSVRWVFAHRAVADARLEFALFAGIGLVGLALTEALLWLLIGTMGLPPVPAKLITSGAVFASNFGLRRLMLFSRRGRPA